VSSSLEREVAALDAVSLALGVGDHERALGLLARYRADFPVGELARDADVLEIETLFEKGEAGPASRAANQFLNRYPTDAHAPRVRALTAASATLTPSRSGVR
jgi:outer membrane protein assembly factor BamD (BamD/ComL family)